MDGESEAVIYGTLEGVRHGQLRGWAVRVEPGAAMRGGCRVRVTSDGVPVAEIWADRFRPDVASAIGCDPNCGFQVPIPDAFRAAMPRSFRVHVTPGDVTPGDVTPGDVTPGDVELGNSPLLLVSLDDRPNAAQLDLAMRMDRLSHDLAELRTHIGETFPEPGTPIADYHRWAQPYYSSLRTRAAALPKAAGAPLVSILMPAWRPHLAHFDAAVASVIAQTYANWELILVDDGSGQPELTTRIAAFCARDPRIRAVPRRDNGNISAATNTAIEAARGEWIAFFDHDDLLADVAIELMVHEARRTGARMLYSDEDKIDQAGRLLEPNLKPDWNYRYLLGCNYICHLLFVQADTLAAVGPLRTEYDGAQDHDLILRLSEVLTPAEIHHVPEVLYHWRKTPNSTSERIGSKQYAVEAGVAAVRDHLGRKGTPASVQAIGNLSLYSVTFGRTALDAPKACIVIPFKDQAATTRRCLDTILAGTAYPCFEIILVDNWSTGADTAAFLADAVQDARVRVLRVEEEFNFSRLNNLAVARTDAELLCFMNNDLFPCAPDWLDRLAGEVLAAPDIAAAAGKYLYPDGTVQHAGVIVGVRNLATHVHQELAAGDLGYLGRARLSQEMTAVTAACMLVRASVFRAVGGFDEDVFRIAFNDVDLCLQMRAAGHRIVFCADMLAEHHESLSRGSDASPENQQRFFQEKQSLLARWGKHPLFLADPAHNRHLAERQPLQLQGEPFCSSLPRSTMLPV